MLVRWKSSLRNQVPPLRSVATPGLNDIPHKVRRQVSTMSLLAANLLLEKRQDYLKLSQLISVLSVMPHCRLTSDMLEVNKTQHSKLQAFGHAQSESLGSLHAVCGVGIRALWPSRRLRASLAKGQSKGPACKGPCMWQSGPSLGVQWIWGHVFHLQLASLGHAHMLLPLARITNLGPQKFSPTARNFLFERHIQQNCRKNMTECRNPHLASTFLVLYWLKAP